MGNFNGLTEFTAIKYSLNFNHKTRCSVGYKMVLSDKGNVNYWDTNFFGFYKLEDFGSLLTPEYSNFLITLKILYIKRVWGIGFVRTDECNSPVFTAKQSLSFGLWLRLDNLRQVVRMVGLL